MALCQGCGNIVDSSAQVCPHCGRQNPARTAEDEGITAVITIVLIVVAAVLALIYS